MTETTPPAADIEAIRKLIWDRSAPEPNCGCWLWMGALSSQGYAILNRGRKQIRAHRLSYEAYKSEIGAGLVLDHLCRVRSCVNPDHLDAVSNKVNLLRGVGAPALNAGKLACKRGHPLTSNNIYIHKGWRQCRECQRVNSRNYKARIACRNQAQA